MTKEQWEINHSYEIALRNLNPIGWSNLTENEKIENLQAIENKNALDNGRLPAEIRVEDMADSQLGYQRENSIVISRAAINSSDYLDVINTEYHEGSHLKDWQAGFISEVRAGYMPNELEARASPIPNPNQDWDGYWNHPAEANARCEGEAGVEKTIMNQSKIADVDRECHFRGNQILETYDYLALNESVIEDEKQSGVQAETSNNESIVESDISDDYGADLDDW